MRCRRSSTAAARWYSSPAPAGLADPAAGAGRFDQLVEALGEVAVAAQVSDHRGEAPAFGGLLQASRPARGADPNARTLLVQRSENAPRARPRGDRIPEQRLQQP